MGELQKTWSVLTTARRDRIPGQIAKLSPELERTLTMPKEPTRFAWVESRIRVPSEVLDGLGLPATTEQLLAQRVKDLVNQSADELTLRRNLMEEMMHSGVPGPARQHVIKRAAELFRSYKKSEIVTPDEILKARTQARGGNYHKRVTSPAGQHRYFYKPEDYEKRHGQHVSGPEAQLTYLQDALTKRLEKSPDGVPIADLKSMVKRHGAAKIHQALRAIKGCVYKAGKIVLKAERFVVMVASDALEKAAAMPIGTPSVHGGIRVRKVAPGKWTPVGKDRKPKAEKKPRPKRKMKAAIELPAALKGLPPKKYQPVLSKKELYEKAGVAQKQFEDLLGSIAKAPGFRSINKKPPGQYAKELQKPGGVVLTAPVKKGKRADQKVRDDYGGDWSQLRDVVRGTVAVDTLDDLNVIFGKLEDAGVRYANKAKDRITKPVPGGYRDVMMHVELPNGVVAELQIHLKPMLFAKDVGIGHKLYDQFRQLETQMKGRKARPKEKAAMAALTAASEKLYGDAWKEIIGKA